MTLVRKASLADVAVVLGFIEKKAAFDLQLGCFEGTLGATAERLGRAMFGAPALAHALVASVGAQSVGFAFYHFRFSSTEARPSLWLDSLYVDEKARRRGCGMELMQALGHEALLRDCTQLGWTVDERNLMAVSFFNKLRTPVFSRQSRVLTYSVAAEQLVGSGAEKRLRQTRPPLPVADGKMRVGPATSQIQFGVPQERTSYKTLVAADTYRDGGSLEVRFACADGSFETIWLQASVDPEFGVRYVHSDLLIFASATREGAFCRIEKQSAEEKAVVAALHQFLRNPKVAVPFSHRTPDEHYLQIVTALLESIPDRVPTERADASQV